VALIHIIIGGRDGGALTISCINESRIRPNHRTGKLTQSAETAPDPILFGPLIAVGNFTRVKIWKPALAASE
jgi:hypothetical protein